jgi:hypothetical protein
MAVVSVGSVCVPRSTVAKPSRARLNVESRAADLVFVQAGVVCFDRVALLLPGVAGSGTSTLVRQLVDLGAVFYSDEYAVLEATGRVLPYPGETKGAARRVGFVLECRYSGAWDMNEGDPAQAWRTLLRFAVPGSAEPARVRATLRAGCEGAKSWQGTRGDAAEAAPRILRWMRGAAG